MKKVETLEDLKEFVKRIPEDRYNQNKCNIIEPTKESCGCILHHLKLNNQISIAGGQIRSLSARFNITTDEAFYIFGMSSCIEGASILLNLEEPKSFTKEDAIKRIETIQKLNKHGKGNKDS